MQEKLGAAILQRAEQAENIRVMREDVLQRISEFVLPNRGDFTVVRSKGQRTDRNVFDTTAVQANRTLAAALGTMLTEGKWFALRPSNKELLENFEVKEYLENVETLMLAAFESPNSGFPQQNDQIFIDMPAYGTACMFIEDNLEMGLIFKNIHLSQISFLENVAEKADSVFRRFKLTARQAAQQFGEENLGPKVAAALGKGILTEFEFVHAVMPRRDWKRMPGFTGDVDQGGFDFPSSYVSIEDKKVVFSKGYHEIPYIIARWSKYTGEIYGRGPGWDTLADTMMANKIKEIIIRAAEKQVDPPLLVSDDGVIAPLRTHPGGVNIGAMSQDGRPLVAQLPVDGRIDIGEFLLKDIQDSIRKGFFVDRFEEKDGTPVTAEENRDRQDTRLRLSAPHIQRIQAEYLSPAVDRVFGIMQRAGTFPEAPEVLRGDDLKVEFVSPLVKAQRSQEAQAYNRAFQSGAGLIEASQGTVMDNVELDESFRDILEIAGVPIENIKSPNEVDEIREQRAEQQKQQQQLAMAKEAVDTAANAKSKGLDIGV